MAKDPVTHLREDHRLIRDMLGILDALVCRISLGCRFPVEDSAVILRFFREFVEHTHHALEARFLYPELMASGDQEMCMLVGELAREHDETKLLLHTLSLLWEPGGELTDEEREHFAGIGRAYAARLRRHIREEENRLLPSISTQEHSMHHGLDDRDRQRWTRTYARLAAEYLA